MSLFGWNAWVLWWYRFTLVRFRWLAVLFSSNSILHSLHWHFIHCTQWALTVFKGFTFPMSVQSLLIPLRGYYPDKRDLKGYVTPTPLFYVNRVRHLLTPTKFLASLKWSYLVAVPQHRLCVQLLRRFVESKQFCSIFDGGVAVASLTIVLYDWGAQDNAGRENFQCPYRIH